MTDHAHDPAADAPPSPAPGRGSRLLLILRVVVFLLIWLGLLFLGAGRLDWVRGWIYVGAYLAMIAIDGVIIFRRDPELLRERWKPRKDNERFDRILSLFYLPLVLGALLLAGLDAGRFGWAPLPFAAVDVGLALFALGDIPIVWAAVHNPYMETRVRIQKDRGQHVITTGPYAIVRHPMYVGIILIFVATPLILGSLWAFAPVGGSIVLLVIRTAMEDRTLQRDLPGYVEYTKKTRYRLLPGVW